MCRCRCRCPWRPEEGGESPGAGISGGHEMPDADIREPTAGPAQERYASPLSPWAVSPVPTAYLSHLHNSDLKSCLAQKRMGVTSSKLESGAWWLWPVIQHATGQGRGL